jgi:DNA (cytosine-5)-methyltransferase 1
MLRSQVHNRNNGHIERGAKVMKYFSMFSGIGGFELGIHNNDNPEANKSLQGGKCEVTHATNDMSMLGSGNKRGRGNSQPATCVGFSEIDKYAIQIYQKHFKGHKNYGNATKINWNNVEDFDLLCGGFPCQAFSIAGKRHGFDDTRGTMFFQIARALREKQPRLCLLENVKGLLSHNKGETFFIILSTLAELGYDCQWQVLNSKNFGVPQNRERVFIIGHLRGTSRPEVFPIGEPDSVPNKKKSSRLQQQHSFCLRDKNGKRYSSEDFISNGSKIRRLTPTECERLQGFPDGWTEGVSDTQRYKCLGNAVTVNVIEAIILKLIKEEKGK